MRNKREEHAGVMFRDPPRREEEQQEERLLAREG